MSDLVTNAEMFLLAGGVVTLTDWKELDPETRAALSAAGYRLRLELAVAVGRAIQNPEVVQAPLDGGQTAVSTLLQQAVHDTVAALTTPPRRVP